MAAHLEDHKIPTRFRLSALWTAVMFCYIYGDYFELYVPNKVSGLLSGENMLDTPAKLFTASFILTVPALMIYLSLVLSPKMAKWLNVAMAGFFTLFTLLVGISSLSGWRIFYVFLSLVESCITFTILWQALHWKKVEGSN